MQTLFKTSSWSDVRVKKVVPVPTQKLSSASLCSHGVVVHLVVCAGRADVPPASLVGVPGTRHSRTRSGAPIRRKHRSYGDDSLEFLHPAREAGQTLMEQLLGTVCAYMLVHTVLRVRGSEQLSLDFAVAAYVRIAHIPSVLETC